MVHGAWCAGLAVRPVAAPISSILRHTNEMSRSGRYEYLQFAAYQRLIGFQNPIASFQDVAIPFLLAQYGLRCREPWIATSRTRSRHLKGYCDRQESNEWDPSCLQINARHCVTTIFQIRIATFRSYVPEITRPTDLQCGRCCHAARTRRERGGYGRIRLSWLLHDAMASRRRPSLSAPRKILVREALYFFNTLLK